MSAPRPIRQQPLSGAEVAIVVVFGLALLGWLALVWFVIRAAWQMLGGILWHP